MFILMTIRKKMRKLWCREYLKHTWKMGVIIYTAVYKDTIMEVIN